MKRVILFLYCMLVLVVSCGRSEQAYFFIPETGTGVSMEKKPHLQRINIYEYPNQVGSSEGSSIRPTSLVFKNWVPSPIGLIIPTYSQSPSVYILSGCENESTIDIRPYHSYFIISMEEKEYGVIPSVIIHFPLESRQLEYIAPGGVKHLLEAIPEDQLMKNLEQAQKKKGENEKLEIDLTLLPEVFSSKSDLDSPQSQISIFDRGFRDDKTIVTFPSVIKKGRADESIDFFLHPDIPDYLFSNSYDDYKVSGKRKIVISDLIGIIVKSEDDERHPIPLTPWQWIKVSNQQIVLKEGTKEYGEQTKTY